MQKFTYKAKTTDGKAVTGIVEASNQDDAIKLLHERRLIIFSLREKLKKTFLPFLLKIKGVSSKEVVDLTRQLATMISSGLTLSRSLSVLQEQSKPGLGKVLNGISQKIEGGATFHGALSAYPQVFSQVYIALVKSGEAAGKLDQILNELADSLENQDAFKRRIKGALIYPMIVVSGMIIVAFIMLVFVIPKLTEMYEEMEAKLPLPTEILIGVSRFMASKWYVILLLVGAAIFTYSRWRQTTWGREITDRLILKVPIIGELITKIVLTQITRTLSMLISAGVPIVEALNIVVAISNNVIFEQSLKMAAKGVEKGLPLTASLERFEEYPPVVIQMISVGEQTGKVGEILGRVANYFEQESEAALKALTTAIEPLMMIVLGVGVGFIIISVITPIYNLTSQF